MGKTKQISEQHVVPTSEELAVLIAAVKAYEENQTGSLFFRKISRASGPSTAWINAGLMEAIDSRKF